MRRRCGFCGERTHRRKDCPAEKYQGQVDRRREIARDYIRSMDQELDAADDRRRRRNRWLGRFR